MSSITARGAVEDAVEVDGDEPVPLIGVHVAELRHDHARCSGIPCVVDQDVDAAELRADFGDTVVHRRVVGDVERRGNRLPARIGDRGRTRDRAVRDHVVDRDRRALRREVARDPGAHALPGTGDERTLPGQVEHSISSIRALALATYSGSASTHT